MRVFRTGLLLFILLVPTPNLEARTFQVTKTADTDDGSCDADCSLREAIGAANKGGSRDDVSVPAGTYLLTLGQLAVSNDATIAGAGQGNTILDGNESDRIFQIQRGVIAEISDVTIQNGFGRNFGGGILNLGTLALASSTISDNTTDWWGGGIYNDGDLALTSSTVSGNTAHDGGGIFMRRATTLTDSTVDGNTASWWGGGIANYSYLSLLNSTVNGNTSYASGGGIRNYYASLNMTNSTVSRNVAGTFGGGISLLTGDVILTNSTVSGNIAVTYGGGVGTYYDGDIVLANSTVSGNSAYDGGGLGQAGSHAPYVEITLGNTIVAGNTANSDDDIDRKLNIVFVAPNLVGSFGYLGPLANNGGPTETHDLLPGSPAIDAGSLDCPPPDTDQRGVPRPQGAYCDIGAVEYVPEPGRWLMLATGGLCLAALSRRRGA